MGFPLPLARALLAEVVGTFGLTLASAVGVVLATRHSSPVEYVAFTAAPGAVIMALIYSIAEISGAHINPAVTFAFALRGVFPLPPSWSATTLRWPSAATSAASPCWRRRWAAPR